MSVNGRTITFTRGDGTTFTITTQDTVTTNSSNWSVSNGTNGWARDNSTGFTLVWGKCVESKVGYTWCTFARSFSTVRNIQTTYDRSSASGDYRASYGLNNSGCNIATDQAHTWYFAIGFS